MPGQLRESKSRYGCVVRVSGDLSKTACRFATHYACDSGRHVDALSNGRMARLIADLQI
jgi:hypothetical protein